MDWLIDKEEVATREQGVEVGKLLVDTDFIHHVKDEHSFEDGNLYFRFRQDGESWEGGVTSGGEGGVTSGGRVGDLW